jgi:DNA-directed RNA polymerase specialized sigma24 family protein
MATRRKTEAKAKRVEPDEKIANLLALLLVKGAKQGEAIMTLARAGFSDEEISSLLNTTGGTIRQTRYMANKKKPE